MSEKFCRDIVMNTLNIVYYYKVFFVKYSKLALQFISSCKKNGVFDSTTTIDSSLTPDYSALEPNLKKCFLYRNTDVWLT